MPIVPAGDLTTLRTTPQDSRMFLIVQQPELWSGSAYDASDFIWYGTVRTAPTTDPIVSLEVTAHASSPAPMIFDGMTVFISSSAYGLWDRGIVRAHGDQTIAGAGANEELYIAVSSDLSDVQVGDFIVVLDEFRFWTRYPRITEAAGALTWYKDYGEFRDNIGAGTEALTWAQLGGTDAARRQASMPAVPIMGPHAVAFIDPDVGSVTVDFDWSDSYAIATGGTVNAWDSEGETDHAGATWTDNVQNPAAKTYSTLSGLRGFRVWLELGTDLQDPIVEYVRGVRYVFTLRRPEEAQSGDPADASPITDFEVSTISGSFSSGGWRASVRVFNSQASEYLILPGALVILFTEDRYGGVLGSVAPDKNTLTDRENIVFVGAIADGTVEQDSETGDVTFDVVSTSELMKSRETYSVPIENDDVADEWYKAADLTVDRAAHHYLTWHTNLKLVADLYQTDNSDEIAAMDFLASDVYSAIDRFIQDRLFARLLCDRFGRFKMDIDQQMQAAGGAATLFTLANTDWVGDITGEQVLEESVSMVDLGGLNYAAGTITPLLSHAPGEVSKYLGLPVQSMSLALTSQAVLNTLSGRLLAYRNNQWPRLTIPLAGNWRIADIWPQEYIVHSLVLERHTFASDKFLVRDMQFDYDATAGILMTTVAIEMETDGPDGVTVDVPEDLPDPPEPDPPTDGPPIPGPEFEDTGRRMLSCDKGVFVTDEIGDAYPIWYAVNTGVAVAEVRCWRIIRDPWHWWTTGGTEKTLWGIFGQSNEPRYLYKHEGFPNGTWVLSLDAAAAGMPGLPPVPGPYTIEDVACTIEVEDRIMVVTGDDAGGFHFGYYILSVDGGASWTYITNIMNAPGATPATWPKASFWLDTAKHSAAETVYAFYPVPGQNARVARSLNGGFNWAVITTGAGAPGSYFEKGLVPYHATDGDDSYIYVLTDNVLANTGVLQVSKDSGSSWTNIASWKTNAMVVSHFAEFTWNREVLAVLVGGKIGTDPARVYYTNDAGDSWTFWALGNQVVGWGALFDFNEDGTLASVLYWDDSNSLLKLANGSTVVNKTGNLNVVSGGVGNVTSIDRDTLGEA